MMKVLSVFVVLFSLLNPIRSATSVNVPLGGNIQTAINTVAASGGGTVNLAAGTYLTTATLYLKSNVTLNGSGLGSTIIQIKDTFNVIEDASEGLTNVTIQNLTVHGFHSTKCYGILIQAGTTYHTNIRLNRVEVAQAGMGVHFKRVNSLTVSACNLHHNGSPDQIGYYHNLYIRSCNDVYVSDCRLDSSTSANGLNVSYCSNVNVSNCTANGNYFRGMRAADSDGFAVDHCTLDSNGDTGLLANTEVVPTKNILWYRCTARNNGNGGFKTLTGVTGVVSDCLGKANKVADYSFSGSITRTNNQ
jgi:parallel beta-helix repeat protein